MTRRRATGSSASARELIGGAITAAARVEGGCGAGDRELSWAA